MSSETAFPTLPVLEAVAERCTPDAMRALRTATVVCVQHLLETTGSMVEALIGLGVRPSNIFIQGKVYSTHRGTIERLESLGVYVDAGSRPARHGHFAEAIEEDVRALWVRVLRQQGSHSGRVIVLDDGAHAITTVPTELAGRAIGVEQTTWGSKRLMSFPSIPVVQVSASAAKKHLEPPLVARAAVGRALAAIPRSANPSVVGVVGLGWVGRAVAEALRSQGFRVLTYDRDDEAMVPGIARLGSRDEVFADSEVVFGCTGEDISRGLGWEQPCPRVLASCSTGDVEFNTLLRHAAASKGDPGLATVTVARSRNIVEIARSGFPVNFDGTAHSVPGRAIQLTRGLLLAGVLQAAEMAAGEVAPRVLSPERQRLIVGVWQRDYEEALALVGRDLLDCFLDDAWIEAESYPAFGVQ